MMTEGSGYIPLTNGSGSGRAKNMWIRIRNTGFYPKIYTGLSKLWVGGSRIRKNAKNPKKAPHPGSATLYFKRKYKTQNQNRESD
jgi:hypothetical protein